MIRSLTQRIRQTLKKLARNIVTIGAAAVAAGLAAPAAARAESPQTVKIKENDRIEANGNGQFSYEIKLSTVQYTQLKMNTPNTAVIVRRMGFSNQGLLVEGVRGDWDDANSTLKIDYRGKGAARAGKDLS